MNTSYLSIATLSLVMCATSGCEVAQVEAHQGVGRTTGITVHSMLTPTSEPPSREERIEMFQESIERQRAVQAILRTSTTWGEADERMRALVVETPEAQRGRLAETAASYMLQSGALDGEAPEVLDAVGHYTEVLVEQGSPDAPVIAAALARLDGHWEAARLREVARQAATVADEMAARRSACEDCETAAPSPAERIDPSRAKARADYEPARAQLHAFAAE